MKTTFLSCPVLALAPFLCAQDGQPAMPDPKTPAHAALATFAGEWHSTCKMAAMPGVPGMEEAKDWTGTEKAELVCNGLWLKASMDAACKGETFQGLWLMGYDPQKQKYVGVWASSHDEPSSISEGSYDAKTKTWSFAGDSPMGRYRSVYVFQDADNSTETCFMTGPDGKETQCMLIVRKRATTKDAAATKGAATTGRGVPALAPELARLAQGVGSWDATVTSIVPGQDPVVEKGTEQVSPVCEGRWYWSDFKGTMMGAPFEGHALTGYDAASKQYVAYWIDTCNAQFATTRGTFDAAKNSYTFAGECVDPAGKPMKLHQVSAQPDADTRTLDMTCTGADQTHQMKVTYTRSRR